MRERPAGPAAQPLGLSRIDQRPHDECLNLNSFYSTSDTQRSAKRTNGDAALFMHIMLIAEHFYPDTDATANILHHLCNFFVEQGHQVTVVRIIDNSKPYEETLLPGITVLRIPIDRSSLKTKFRRLLRSGRMFSAALHSAVYLLTAVLKRMFSADPFLLEQALSARALIRVARETSADVVVTTCDPFWTHNFGLLLKRWCKLGWTMYMLDPYFDNPTRDQSASASARRLAEEEVMVSAADTVIVTPGIYASYSRSPLRRYLDKVKPLELPMVRDLTSQTDIPVPIDQDYVNCSFVGHLYPELRDPKFVFEVFKKIEDPHIRLNFIGGVYGEFPQGYLEALTEPLGQRLVFHPTVDPDTAVACLRQSNALVHIGNRGTDMFPSKFLDYCSTGRPIINFYWSDDCPTLPIARRYRLCLNIAMSQDASESIAREVEAFILANASQRMTYEEVAHDLGCRSSDEVAADFLRFLESNLHNRRRRARMPRPLV